MLIFEEKKSTLLPKIKPTLSEYIAVRVLRKGVIPKHIVLLLDGNRRWGRRVKIDKMAAHEYSYTKFAEALIWCRYLGIREVTLQCFSIDNFTTRDEEERTYQMDIFRRCFLKAIQEASTSDSFPVRIKFYGRIDLLAPELREMIAKIEVLTAKYDKLQLNVGMVYNGSDEICKSITSIRSQVKSGQLAVEEITEKTLNDNMYFAGSKDPDIFLRTSGRNLISDVQTWQTGLTHILFPTILWPDFTIWNFFAAILAYQLEAGKIKQAQERYEAQMRFLEK